MSPPAKIAVHSFSRANDRLTFTVLATFPGLPASFSGDDLQKWLASADPPGTRYGVAVDGELVRICSAQADAHDYAAQCRSAGQTANVIRIPAGA